MSKPNSKDNTSEIPGKTKNKTTHKILLVGNPNVGKSALFQALSGQFVEISNYPGTTIEVKETELDSCYSIIDTPGVYGISEFNDEERITHAAIEKLTNLDFVINVVNATTLQKDLFLTLQLIDLKIPLVLVINQIDELVSQDPKSPKTEINFEKLKTLLGVKIFPVSAINGTGISALKEFIQRKTAEISGQNKTVTSTEFITSGNQSLELDNHIFAVQNKIPTLNNQETLMLLEEDAELVGKYKEILAQNKIKLPGRNKIYQQRRERANRIVDLAVSYQAGPNSFAKVLDRFLINPFFGTVFAVFVAVFFLYQVLGIWVAGDLVKLTEKKVFEKYWNPTVKWTISQVFPTEIIVREPQNGLNVTKQIYMPNGMLQYKKQNPQNLDTELKLAKFDIAKDYIFSPADLVDSPGATTKLKQTFWSSLATILAGKYGILTLAVTYLLAVLLPLVWFFYLSWALLEDSGYLPRLAVLADGFLRKIGLNGRGIIPLVLGLGCVTMAVATTRLMSNKREQLIMMILLAIAVPCSAQLGIIQGLLAKNGGLVGWSIWIGVVVLALIISGLIANKLIKGLPSPLILELPPLRKPLWKNVLTKANQKSYFFLKESGVAFFWASLAVGILQVTGFLTLVINSLKPLIQGILHLPSEVSLSFLLGMVRRDFGAFGLLDLDLTRTQVVTASVTLTLFVPCIATLGLMIKERNLKTALGIWFLSWIVGFGVGGGLTRLLEFVKF